MTRVDFKIVRRIYDGVYVSIVTYAAGGWAEGLTGQYKGKLISEQRKVVNAVTKAYRTVSGSAGKAIVGVIPLDLEIEKRCASYSIWKYGEAVFNDSIVQSRGSKRKVNRLVITAWQRMWEPDAVGRWKTAWWTM